MRDLDLKIGSRNYGIGKALVRGFNFVKIAQNCIPIGCLQSPSHLVLVSVLEIIL